MAGLGEYENVNAQSGLNEIEGESLLGHDSEFSEDDYVRKKNWPVCKPYLYHNIVRDIDDAKLRHAVRVCYYLWYVFGVAFIINTVAVGSAFYNIAEDHWTNWVGLILSLVYFAVCWPLAFVVYYYLGYEGARLRSSVKMGTFFCAYPAQVALCAWLALGIPKTGGGGLVLLVGAWGASEMSTVMLNAVAFVTWVLICLSSAYVLYVMWRSFKQARAANPQPQQQQRTSIEDDDATDTFIDVEEEAALARAREQQSSSSSSSSSSSTSSFSSWGMPAKLNLALPGSKKEKAENSSPVVETQHTQVTAAPNYDLPSSFLD